eukprot:3189755-Rhodomonas_salina.2
MHPNRSLVGTRCNPYPGYVRGGFPALESLVPSCGSRVAGHVGQNWSKMTQLLQISHNFHK